MLVVKSNMLKKKLAELIIKNRMKLYKQDYCTKVKK